MVEIFRVDIDQERIVGARVAIGGLGASSAPVQALVAPFRFNVRVITVVAFFDAFFAASISQIMFEVFTNDAIERRIFDITSIIRGTFFVAVLSQNFFLSSNQLLFVGMFVVFVVRRYCTTIGQQTEFVRIIVAIRQIIMIVVIFV